MTGDGEPQDETRDSPADSQGRNAAYLLEYYTRPFFLFHQALEAEGFVSAIPHPKRRQFWQLVLPGQYDLLESRNLLAQYLISLEDELRKTIGKHCLAYWLHIYRRLSPGPSGADNRPQTTGLVRVALEAAFQKYAGYDECLGVGTTDRIPIEEVLDGLLTDAGFEAERSELQRSPQLVLRRFDLCGLREFYEVEKLAYEVWRSTAQLRAVAKGARLAVESTGHMVSEIRDAELARLIDIYDARQREYDISAKGVVYGHLDEGMKHGVVFVPTYNLAGIPSADLSSVFARFGSNVVLSSVTNFIWVPFSVRAFREAHLPFADAFADLHSVRLDAVLLVLCALLQRVFYAWKEDGLIQVVRSWQRAYDGPYTREYILGEIEAFLPASGDYLGIERGQIDRGEWLAAVEYLSLKESDREGLDVRYPGPHQVFLPYGHNRLFVDYAWIARRLYDLFVGVSIPDQNFKGEALEAAVRGPKSVLPSGPCISTGDGRRQIDAAFALGKRLVVIECRAVGKSIGFDRGDLEAINYRANLVDKALADADDKANWISEHPRGTNYDIRRYCDILPVAVTPFVEYIASLDSYYWVSEATPRIMTPGELKRALTDGVLSQATKNVVQVRH